MYKSLLNFLLHRLFVFSNFLVQMQLLLLEKASITNSDCDIWEDKVRIKTNQMKAHNEKGLPQKWVTISSNTENLIIF